MYILILVLFYVMLILKLKDYVFNIEINRELQVDDIEYYRKNGTINILDKHVINKNPEMFMTRKNFKNRMLFSVGTANNSWTDKKEKSVQDMSILNMCKIVGGVLTGKSFAMVTGGTSGTYFYQWFDLGDCLRGAYSFISILKRGGITQNDRILVYYRHGANSVKLLEHLSVLIPGFCALSPVIGKDGSIDADEARRFLNKINTFKPDALLAFPNQFFRLCQHIYQNGMEVKHQPKYIDISADLFFRCQYDFIKNYVFPQSTIRLSYGTVEFGQVAVQIPIEEMKTDDDFYTYDILKDCIHLENQGKNLVITSYLYKTLPLIRYRIDDEGIVDDDKIYKLIGKNTCIEGKHVTESCDILKVNSNINKLNKYGCSIIDVRYTDKFNITVLDKSNIELIYTLFNPDNVNIITCDKNSCETTSNFNKKVWFHGAST